jgi:hypothetical protein
MNVKARICQGELAAKTSFAPTPEHRFALRHDVECAMGWLLGRAWKA